MLTRALVIALVVLGGVAEAQPVLTPWRPPTGCTSGQVIQFNGVAWVCATPVVFSTNNTIPKGNGTGLTASSWTDDGTTSTTTGNIATGGNIILTQSGDTYIYDQLALSSGNQDLNLYSAGTGEVTINSNQGGIANAGTGGLKIYGGANGSTAQHTFAANGDATHAGVLTVQGNISKFNSGETYLYAGALNSYHTADFDGLELWVNYVGFNGGATRYRTFIVGDGRNNIVAKFTGSTKLTELIGALAVDGNTTLGDAIGDSTTIHGATTTVGADANAGATTALIVKNPSNAASTTTDIALQDGSGDLWRVSANNVTGVTAVTGDTDFNGTIRLLSGNPTTTNRIDVVNSSHINTTGNDPALSSCGSSPSIIGADLAGVVTVGSGGPTSCTVTFDNAYITNPPACVVTSLINSAEPLYISSISTSAFTVTTNAGTDLSGGKFNYICIGVP